MNRPFDSSTGMVSSIHAPEVIIDNVAFMVEIFTRVMLFGPCHADLRITTHDTRTSRHRVMPPRRPTLSLTQRGLRPIEMPGRFWRHTTVPRDIGCQYGTHEERAASALSAMVRCQPDKRGRTRSRYVSAPAEAVPQSAASASPITANQCRNQYHVAAAIPTSSPAYNISARSRTASKQGIRNIFFTRLWPLVRRGEPDNNMTSVLTICRR